MNIEEASDALTEAVEAWKSDGTLANADRVEVCAFAFVNELTPLVGPEVAFRYQTAWEGWITAIQRQSHLIATRGDTSVDDADVMFMNELKKVQEERLAELESVGREVQARLERMRAEGSGDE